VVQIWGYCLLTGDDSGEDVEVSGPQVTDMAEEGSATVHYHYLMDDPDLEFKIEPVLLLVIDQGDTPGSFDVTGIGETRVQMRIAANGANRCNVHCDVILRFAAVGEIQLDSSGACIIPMSFQFTPQADEWILETDCREEMAAVIDCAEWSMVMADPSVYTFTNSKRDVILPSESGVTLRAEIKNVIMPRDTEGICNW
jgi:hypothetical protein